MADLPCQAVNRQHVTTDLGAQIKSIGSGMSEHSMVDMASRLESGLSPPEFADRVQSHIQTLDRLSQNLKSLGMGKAEIDSHVTGILDVYQSELTKAIARLNGEG